MKKLLATSALAIVAMSGAASAQSVLERVLSQIDNTSNLAPVNGTFANIAENIGGGETIVYQDGAGNILTEAQFNSAIGDQLSQDLDAADVYVDADGVYWEENGVTDIRIGDYNDALIYTQQWLVANGDLSVSVTGAGEGINGSINNTLDGIDVATQEAIASATVSATEWNMPTVDLGDMATTALGAVNTGDITLGVNSAVDEASTSTTNAVSAVMTQLGGSADTGAIVLNVASNMTGVNGSINNVMNEVNGSIGNLSTTALGAVNTGTIVSGVDAAVAGIVGSSAGQ